jgi:hypothetical protein
LARTGRELAESLESMSNDLMAKAVELDTDRERQAKEEKRPSATRKTASK